jgi:hypothetical protein
MILIVKARSSWPCPEDAVEGQALREPGRGASVSGPLGRTQGRQAHPWPHQAAGSRDIRRREAFSAAVAAGAAPLLPVRRTHLSPASKWMRPTTERRKARSDANSTSSGTRCSCSFSIRAPVNCYANIWARSVADIASSIETFHWMSRHPLPYTVLPPGDDQRAHFSV